MQDSKKENLEKQIEKPPVEIPVPELEDTIEKKEVAQPPKPELPPDSGKQIEVSPPEVQKPPLESKEVIYEKSELRQEIERILEDGLGEIFENLPEQIKGQFAVTGEKLAAEIEELIKNYNE